MTLKKITLKHNNKKFPLIVKDCNLLEKVLGLMFFKQKALLLFNFKKPKKFKIHSFFCAPFLAVYTDEKNDIQEIIKITSWKPLILPRNKFNKLIEIPLIPKYSKLTKHLLEIPVDNRNI
jgi:uncharacterized membrane protein (UPF0127 family)